MLETAPQAGYTGTRVFIRIRAHARTCSVPHARAKHALPHSRRVVRARVCTRAAIARGVQGWTLRSGRPCRAHARLYGVSFREVTS
jgi:hypothetical protein